MKYFSPICVTLALFLSAPGCGSSNATATDNQTDDLEVRSDGARRLTSGAGGQSSQNPCFSPDGDFLVFTRFENGYNIGPAHLYRLDLTPGAEAAPLTSGDFDDVNVPYGCFDRTTGRVVFASDRENANDFWSIVPIPNQTDSTRLTSHGELPVWIEPVYSPAGGVIAFESGPDVQDEEMQRSGIYTIIPTTSELVQITNFDGASDDRLPSWSPDGTQLLYQHRDPTLEDSLDRWEAWVIPAAGGTPANLSSLVTRNRPGPDTDLSWMANGRYVLSSAPHGGINHPNIFLLPVAGGEMSRLTNDAAHEDGAPCSSPDSRQVAFESHRTEDENSPSEIWIIDTPAEFR